MRVSMLNYEMLSEEERYLIVMSNIYDVTKTALSDSLRSSIIEQMNSLNSDRTILQETL